MLLFHCLASARPTTLSKNELDGEDDLFGQLTQPTVATNEGEREFEETDQWSCVLCILDPFTTVALPTQKEL